MNTYCYTLAIRQRTCENGISRSNDNVYTNITPNSVIPLNFGYNITFLSGTSTYASIQISNSNQIPNLIFNISSGNYKIFDLPVQNGTLRVYIGVSSIICSETVVCSTIR